MLFAGAVGADAPAPAPLAKANLYQLHGAHHHVTYSTTSLDGKPHLTYQDEHGSRTFIGPQIQTTASAIGTLLTVTLQMTVDAGSTTFSVLIPTVNVVAGTEAPVKTLGITTMHRVSIVPALNKGQTEIYESVALAGNAKLVMF